MPFKSCGRLSADNGPVRVPHCHLTCPLGLGGPGWGYCLGGKRWWGLRGVGESGRGRRACGARPSPPSAMPRHLLPLWSFLYTLRLLIFARRLLAPCVWCAYSWMIVVRGRAGGLMAERPLGRTWTGRTRKVGTVLNKCIKYIIMNILLVPCSAKLLYSLEHPKIAIDIYIPNQSPSKGSFPR